MQTEPLFQKIESLKQKYQELNKLTAQDFNIFQILNIGHLETSVHSKFIAYLLNPHSDHAQKDTFLKLFLNGLNMSDFKTKNACVEIEKYTGDGFIDIYIREGAPNPRLIVIENKIFARDQAEQMMRYYNYAKNNTTDENKISLYYLTLTGTEPSTNSLGDLKVAERSDDENPKNVKLLAYRTDIITWIDACIKEMELIPSMREILSQYAHLIRILTGGTQNQKYMKDLQEEILKGENYKFLSDLEKVIPQIKINIQTKLWEKMKELFKKNGYQVENNPKHSSIASNVQDFYYKTKSNKHYGLYIKIRDIKDLWLRIGIYNEGIYANIDTGPANDERLDEKTQEHIINIARTISEIIVINHPWRYLQWDSFKLNNLNFGTFSDLEYSLHKEENLTKVLEPFIQQCDKLFHALKSEIHTSSTK